MAGFHHDTIVILNRFILSLENFSERVAPVNFNEATNTGNPIRDDAPSPCHVIGNVRAAIQGYTRRTRMPMSQGN